MELYIIYVLYKKIDSLSIMKLAMENEAKLNDLIFTLTRDDQFILQYEESNFKVEPIP